MPSSNIEKKIYNNAIKQAYKIIKIKENIDNQFYILTSFKSPNPMLIDYAKKLYQMNKYDRQNDNLFDQDTIYFETEDGLYEELQESLKFKDINSLIKLFQNLNGQHADIYITLNNYETLEIPNSQNLRKLAQIMLQNRLKWINQYNLKK